MSLTVKINIKDDKGKEAEIEIKETDNLSKLVIVQNVFNIFGIDKDIFEQVKEFEKIGRVYSSFFNSMNQDEKTREKAHNSEEIREKMIKGFQEIDEPNGGNTEENEVIDDQPVWVKTGIKIDPEGRRRYKCRYHCVICNIRATHYIFEGSAEIKCHSCKAGMPVFSASPEGFPNRDTHGNYYRAGEYQDFKLF